MLCAALFLRLPSFQLDSFCFLVLGELLSWSSRPAAPNRLGFQIESHRYRNFVECIVHVWSSVRPDLPVGSQNTRLQGLLGGCFRQKKSPKQISIFEFVVGILKTIFVATGNRKIITKNAALKKAMAVNIGSPSTADLKLGNIKLRIETITHIPSQASSAQVNNDFQRRRKKIYNI
jgi:hypothetical protein